MIKHLKPYLTKYRLPSILAPITVIAEVLLEIQIPFLMAKIVDQGITTRDLSGPLFIAFRRSFRAFCRQGCHGFWQ